MGQGGKEDRLGEAHAAARVCGFASQVGGVERTFSWLSQNRRMSKDYERLCASAEAFVYAAMIRLMVRRLARA
jgi:transposase